MVHWEEMPTVESIHGEAVGNEFSRHHSNVMLVKRRVSNSVPFLVLKEVNKNWYCLEAVVVATRVLGVH